VIIYFALHRTVWGVPPASSDGKNIKPAWLFISRYIELDEVCHPPVLMEKNIKPAWLFISRYIKLYEVCHPPVLMEKNIRAAWLLISRYIELYVVCHPPVLMDKTVKLRGYLFRVTSNCLRRIMHLFWWTNLTNNKLLLSAFWQISCRFSEISGQMRPLVPLAGGFITLQPRLLTFLSSTGIGPGICKRSRAIKHSNMYYFPMMSSFPAVGVTKRLANQKLRRRDFEIFRVGLTLITHSASPSAS